MMRIGIYFASKHGQTRKIADFLAQEFRSLGHEVRSMDLSKGSGGPDNILEFDAVLVGAPVYQRSYPQQRCGGLSRVIGAN
jgi:menaquinone-dependent protoporphyrinogen IX oxidase